MRAPALRNIYTCFPGGKHKVLTMSYDDGKTEDRRLVDIFNKHGIRGTFNVNAGLQGDPRRVPFREYRDLYAGHEIACHTYTHPTIARSPVTEVVRQVLRDRMELEDIVGRPVRGLAYPNGSYSREIMELLPKLGIRYARVVPTTGEFGMPEDFLAWRATCHHNGRLLELGRQFTELYKTQYLYMMYVWGHSYEFADYDNWDVIERFCELMGGREDIWYATNIEIADYMDAAARVQFTAAGDRAYNPNACSIWLEVDGKKVEIPAGELMAL